jgi:uncharacterized membrane protein YoaK (UPF0700 family)
MSMATRSTRRGCAPGPLSVTSHEADPASHTRIPVGNPQHVPRTGDAIAGEIRHAPPQGRKEGDAGIVFLFAVALTAGTGAMDVACFVRLGNVFASVMTGNLVLLGLAAARLSGALAAHTLVAFAGFVTGVAAGSRLVPAGKVPEGNVHHRVPAVLLVELVLLAGFTAGWELTGAAPHGGNQLVLVAVAAAAMGMQSAAARGLSARVSTTYLTSTLTTVVASLVHPGSRKVQWREATQLLALASGAAVGGLVLATAPAVLPAIPLAALVLVIGATATLGLPPVPRLP